MGQRSEGRSTKVLIPEMKLKWDTGKTKWELDKDGIRLGSGVEFIKMKLANCHSPSAHSLYTPLIS